MLIPNWFSRHIFYPLWDVWDRSEKLIELQRLNISQWSSRSSILELQKNRIKAIVSYARKHSPYYRDRLDVEELDYDADHHRDILAMLPITSKADIRGNLQHMVSDEYTVADLANAKTGGSTGFSLNLYFDKRCQEFRNAAAIRTDIWAGWSIGQPRGEIWGNPPVADTLKKKVRQELLDRSCCLDTMSMTSHSMRTFYNECIRQDVRILFGHAHSIYLYAQFVENQMDEPPIVNGVIATSMMLPQHERKLIERSLQCKVTNRYGCEEVGLISCECEEHNGLHINAEHVYVEFLRDDGSQADEGEIANIVVTDLVNKGMPLIRYKIEDRGFHVNRPCPCGRGLPLMGDVSGRVADFLKKKDGTEVAGISLIQRTLTDIPGLEQIQFVQNSLDELIVNRVKSREYSIHSDEALVAELASIFGPATKIEIVDVDSIPQAENGKYRFSICNI